MRRPLPYAIFLAYFACACGAAPLPIRVVVVANASDPGSLAVAAHYMRARVIPPRNLIALPLPLEETISWSRFVRELWGPLQERLIADGWIQSLPATGLDRVGRRLLPIYGHSIDALVLCRGVPLRIEDDPRLAVAAAAPGRFRTNAGAVDSELSLLAWPGGYPIDNFVPNPLFRQARPSPAQRLAVVEVCRLDGPSVEDAKALVDGAVAAERTGLAGRAYVDLGGRYPTGDAWLEQVAVRCRSMGFDTDVDREPDTFPIWARFDHPALYFGWYTADADGPFTLPGFRFPAGAIAMHIHSFSAHTLRSATEGWCGPLIARGAAVTLGNVWEPYLELTHRPDLLLEALQGGAALADAAYYALPVLSWQGVVIGDPLYRPFGDVGRARAAGAAAYNLGAALSRAERNETDGGAAAAVSLLGPWLGRPLRAPDDWAVLAGMGELFMRCGRPDLAVQAFQRLLAIHELPVKARRHWLARAGAVAAAAGDNFQVAVWKQEADRLSSRKRDSTGLTHFGEQP